METLRRKVLPELAPPAQRFIEQTRRYRESVELYHDAMRSAAEVRARVRRARVTDVDSPPAEPAPRPQNVAIARPVVAYRGLEHRIVDDPTMPLSEREREVAVLVARGCSNDEIARSLVITSGTAANHVARIMRKLGVRSRTGIGAWAVERGLATR